MSEVTQILSKIESGDQKASEELLPLVYGELRRLAAARMANERPDHTLQATALVHEAYVRLVDVETVKKWDSRGHFFSAAAEAMRRLLVDHARTKNRAKRGGGQAPLDLADFEPTIESNADLVLEISEAIEALKGRDAGSAEFVKLRYFGGLSVVDTAAALGLPAAKAYSHWAYAKGQMARLLRK